MKNKVKVQRMRVKSKSNKKNHVKDPICDVNVTHTMLNANPELICVKCNQCMFDANHDVYFLDFVNDVNVRSKSKFTLEKIVHLKETTSNSVETSKPEIKVYSRRPKQVKSVGSSKKANTVESKIANNSEPTHLWGSNATNVPSSSSLVNDSEDLGKLNTKADIGIFVGYVPAKKAFRIYNRRTWKIMETIHVMFDELTAMASEQFSSGPGLQVMTPATSSSGLVPNSIPQQPCNPPNRDDWDCLFQPMFDEYFNPPTIGIFPVPVVVALRAVDIADSPVSMSIDQDAPSIKSPKTPHFHDDPLHESLHEDSTSQGSSSNVRPTHTQFELIGRWTMDHPIVNVIGDPFRSVSTRKQLKTDVMRCYFDTFLTYVEPKNFKQAMTKPSWINAMQEEIHEFERLQVWELVLCPDKLMLIKLKWIYKVKTDEFGGVLKNKARLVAQVFRKEEGINFEESFTPVEK
ncbi:retrovirus-related pol polyprotein from transposon TNT 1-94 [Tanacetum coccineum]